MAWVNIPNIYMPHPLRYSVSASTLLNMAAGVNLRVGWVFVAPRDGTITGFRFGLQTVTTPQLIRGILENVNGAYAPDDGEDQVSTATIDPTGQSNTVQSFSFSPGRTVARGDIVAAVVRAEGTVPLLTFLSANGNTSLHCGNSLAWLHTSGSWQAQNCAPLFALEWSDGGKQQPLGCVPPPATLIVSATTFNQSSSPDEYGVRITLPYSCTVVGVWHAMDPVTFSDAIRVRLYQESNVVESADMPFGNGQSLAYYEYLFPTGRQYRKGDVLRATVTSITANNLSVTPYAVDVADRLNYVGQQTDSSCHMTTRTDLGAWTDTTTSRVPCGLIIGAIDDGTGPATASWFPQGTILQEGPPIIIPGQG